MLQCWKKYPVSKTLFRPFIVETNWFGDLFFCKFSITRTIFSHSRSEQFLKQNTKFKIKTVFQEKINKRKYISAKSGKLCIARKSIFLPYIYCAYFCTFQEFYVSTRPRAVGIRGLGGPIWMRGGGQHSKRQPKLWNQVPSSDYFVVQNFGDFLFWKYKEVVCFNVSNVRQ